MTPSSSLPEVLQTLFACGYQLADVLGNSLPSDFLQSHDWRLDSVYNFRENAQGEAATLVVAVSSPSRSLKLVFVQAVESLREFSPMVLLRKLFPMKPKPEMTLGSR